MRPSAPPSAAALLAKLDWVGDEQQGGAVPSPPKPEPFTPAGVVLASRLSPGYTQAQTTAAKAAVTLKSPDREEAELMDAIRALEGELAVEDAEIAQLAVDEEQAAAALAQAAAERLDIEAQLQQLRRIEARQRARAKLLQLQLTVATQLYGVAESLSHVAAVPGTTTTAKGAEGAAEETVRHRDREIGELKRALKRQQQLVADAHRQLLELATRGRPLGAAAAVSSDVTELRAALAEQEMRRLMAEARSDELQAQVRLFEEQGLRMRLHPLPPGEEEARAHAQPPTSPAAAKPTSSRSVAINLYTPGDEPVPP